MAKLFRAAIMGPPGSGKGTISKRIAQSFGLLYLSCGHYLRESIVAKTGKKHLSHEQLFGYQMPPCSRKKFSNTSFSALLMKMRDRYVC